MLSRAIGSSAGVTAAAASGTLRHGTRSTPQVSLCLALITSFDACMVFKQCSYGPQDLGCGLRGSSSGGGGGPEGLTGLRACVCHPSLCRLCTHRAPFCGRRCNSVDCAAARCPPRCWACGLCSRAGRRHGGCMLPAACRLWLPLRRLVWGGGSAQPSGCMKPARKLHGFG
jgi:hypothetical protein